jgi:hypothetical protein
MTAEEYRAAIRALGLNQTTAGTFLGVNPVTSRRRALGAVKVPPEAAMLLRLMLAMKLTPAKVEEWLKDAR